jgi:hypothetical protein
MNDTVTTGLIDSDQPAKRFCNRSEAEIQEIVKDKDAASTKKATTRNAVKTLRAYL